MTSCSAPPTPHGTCALLQRSRVKPTPVARQKLPPSNQWNVDWGRFLWNTAPRRNWMSWKRRCWGPQEWPRTETRQHTKNFEVCSIANFTSKKTLHFFTFCSYGRWGWIFASKLKNMDKNRAKFSRKAELSRAAFFEKIHLKTHLTCGHWPLLRTCLHWPKEAGTFSNSFVTLIWMTPCQMM